MSSAQSSTQEPCQQRPVRWKFGHADTRGICRRCGDRFHKGAKVAWRIGEPGVLCLRCYRRISR